MPITQAITESRFKKNITVQFLRNFRLLLIGRDSFIP